MRNVIEIKGVTKDYGDFKLDNINMVVPKGGICGFIGQNGAGKTTTIRLILDIIKADSGEIRVWDSDMSVNGKELKESIGVVYDEMGFHEFMTPKQLDKMFRNIYKNWDSNEFREYLNRFSLPFNKKCGDFSRGMRMKLQIAVALSHKAKLLIMDEPTSGLDPIVRAEMLDIFQEFVTDEEHTILFSSHITSDLERIADWIVFINRGKVFLSGNREELLEKHGIIKCSDEEKNKIDNQYIVGNRSFAYGVEVMVNDRKACMKEYPDLVMDRAGLEDILTFYVLGK